MELLILVSLALAILCALFVAVSSKRFGIPALMALFAASLAAFARIFIITKFVEQNTGFYQPSPAITVFHSALILLGVWGIIHYFVMRKKSEMIEIVPVFSYSFASVLGAIGYLSALVGSLMALMASEKLNFAYVLMMFSALVGAVAMICSMPTVSRKNGPELSLVFIGPLCFTSIHLFRSFLDHVTVASVSEYLFDVIMLCLVLIFQYTDARCRSGQNKRAGMVVSGLLSLPAIAISIIPKIYFTIAGGRPVFSEAFTPIYAVYLLLIPYIVSRVASVRKKEKYL